MKSLAATLLLLLATACATPPANDTSIASIAATLEQLKQQADEWDRAIVRKDRAALDANMAEDFRQIDAVGSLDTKQSFLDSIDSPLLTIDPYVAEEFQVRLYGDTALLSGRTQMSWRYDGKPYTANYRYVDVYVKRGGRWQLVNVQITKIPPS